MIEQSKTSLKEHNKVMLLPIEDIAPSPFQARTVFDEQEIKKLAVSILQNGLLQPISVRPTADGRYQLIAGERRLRACKLVGLETIPSIVYQFEDNQTAALLTLTEQQEKICTDNDLTERHARAVLRLPTPEARTMVLEKAVERHYNVMQTEELIERLVQGRHRPNAA